jgi:uncharacterized protein (DUF305 family)
MKKSVFLMLFLALSVLGAACSQPTNNGNATASHAGMNHNSTMNHNGMPMNAANHNMSQMQHGEMKSDAGAASQPYDLQFIDTMVHHHEGAIQMSKSFLDKTQNEELKKFAQQIINDQQKEIAQMMEWREKWFAGKPPAKNMEMPGMMDSMKMMSGDHMKMMETMSGKDSDTHFLDMMIPHHDGALTMSKDALQKAEHAEIKTLANNIIKAQEAEIKKMNDWKTAWAK